MKKVLGISALLILIVIVSFRVFPNKNQTLTKDQKTQNSRSNGKEQNSENKEPEKSIFVPYWTLNNPFNNNEYDTIIYFGISVNDEGIDEEEPGYQNIEKFINLSTNSQKKMLTLRMLDNEQNIKILNDKVLSVRIIERTISIAKENGFQGIVLDLETKSLAFDTATKRNTDFIVEFAQSTKNAKLDFYTLLFGDTYYRARAYDVKQISEASDRIMIMAYDFHKAGGNPGPNFPLENKNAYGYDFEKMIEDFSSDSPAEKISIVYGMFGYDWTVDNKGDSTSVAKAVTTNQAQSRFIQQCELKDCDINVDQSTHETSVKYTDEENKPHQVWFETKDSIIKKIEVAKQNNIYSDSYWANSFF